MNILQQVNRPERVVPNNVPSEIEEVEELEESEIVEKKSKEESSEHHKVDRKGSLAEELEEEVISDPVD